MNSEYKYVADRRSRLITLGVGLAVLAGLGLFTILGDGSYLPASIMATLLGITLLYVLSIPVKMRITDTHLEILCILEMTRIHVGDIKRVEALEPARMRATIPILGSYGFFGYYGYYLNLKSWEMVKVYASRWSNFVEIEDIYEQKYIVSADDPAQFIESLNKAIRRHTEQLYDGMENR